MTTAQTILLGWGLVAHCAADWFLQNHWQNAEKSNPRLVGGYVHAALHALCAALVFPWPVALALGLAHWFIDLRWPLVKWGELVRQSTPEQAGAAYIPFAMGRDQAAHILCTALAAWWCGR